MQAPRFAREGRLAFLTAFMLGLASPVVAQTGQDQKEGVEIIRGDSSPSSRRTVSQEVHKRRQERPVQEDSSDEEEDRPLTEAERQRVLLLLAGSTMTYFIQGYPPPDSAPPLASSPPSTTPEGNPTPTGGPTDNPNTSPEPASVITGLLGSGLAGLFTYARKRRQRRRMRLDVLADVNCDGLELAMAA